MNFVDRRKRRRFRHQILLAVIAIALMGGLYPLLPARTMTESLSMVTAYAALLFLASALIIGPLNVLRATSNPLSSYLRRDIGIVAGAFAIVHTVIGLQVHMRGDFMQYFFLRTGSGGIGNIRLDMFGIANHLGLFATIVIIVLLGISNNMSIHRFGPTRWKSAQRWIYIGAGMVIIHGLMYQIIEKRRTVIIGFLLATGCVVLALQLLGLWRRIGQSGQLSRVARSK